MKSSQSRIITTDDILGKVAVDPDAKPLGIVMKIHVDVANNGLIGISVDTGFMKPDLYAGVQFIRFFGKERWLA